MDENKIKEAGRFWFSRHPYDCELTAVGKSYMRWSSSMTNDS